MVNYEIVGVRKLGLYSTYQTNAIDLDRQISGW
jgi:hypothetical protein